MSLRDDGALFVCLLVLLAIVFVGLVFFLSEYMPSDDAGFERSRQTMSLALQIAGGIVVLFAFLISWHRMRAAQRSADAALRNAEAVRDGQLTDRFSRAVEHLASEKMDMRLGGIYELERIAHESERDHWPVMEVLAAYVRRLAGLQSQMAKEYQKIQPRVRRMGRKLEKSMVTRPRESGLTEIAWSLPEDVITIIKVIGKRNLDHESEKQRIDLTRTYLAGLDAESLDLSRVDFSGSVLAGANFFLGKMRRTNFEDVDLSEANFAAAQFYLVKFIRADLTRANFRNAKFTKEMTEMRDCNLEETDFSSTDMSGIWRIKPAEFEKAKRDDKTTIGSHTIANE